MKIAKGTMVFEIITKNWYETKYDLDDCDLIAKEKCFFRTHKNNCRVSR